MANDYENWNDFDEAAFVSELYEALNPPAPITPYYDPETGLTWQGGYEDWEQNRGNYYDASGDGIVDFTTGGADWNAAQMTTDLYEMAFQNFPGNINPYTGKTFAETPFEDFSNMGLSNIETFRNVDWTGIREQTSQNLADIAQQQENLPEFEGFKGGYTGLSSNVTTDSSMWEAVVNTRFKL